MNENDILFLIPARKGSKGFPNKNSLGLGFPKRLSLVERAVEAAQTSEYGKEAVILISTDADEGDALYTVIGRCEVEKVRRPDELATDGASMMGVVEHALTLYPDAQVIVLLQPTSPLRTAEDINGALDKFFDVSAECLASVCETNHPPQLSMLIDEQEHLTPVFGWENFMERRQNYPKTYRQNGAIYIFKRETFLEHKTFHVPDKIVPYIMPKDRSIDVDSEDDFKLADSILGGLD